MVILSFPNWSDALESGDLSTKERRRHRVIINWFLGHLKRENKGASIESAREFLKVLIETRRPEAWQVEQWREGINWFFRAAPVRKRLPDKRCQTGKSIRATVEAHEAEHPANAAQQAATERNSDELEPGDGRREYAHTVAELQDRVPVDPWYDETVRLMRVRHMAYRTEETYLGWIRRMERFLKEKDGLETFGEEDLKRFLSYLAVEEGVAVSTQRQALNAGVFFLLEVRKMELGDFSDYTKADPRKYYPVVYSKGEIKALLDSL